MTDLLSNSLFEISSDTSHNSFANGCILLITPSRTSYKPCSTAIFLRSCCSLVCHLFLLVNLIIMLILFSLVLSKSVQVVNFYFKQSITFLRILCSRATDREPLNYIKRRCPTQYVREFSSFISFSFFIILSLLLGKSLVPLYRMLLYTCLYVLYPL